MSNRVPVGFIVVTADFQTGRVLERRQRRSGTVLTVRMATDDIRFIPEEEIVSTHWRAEDEKVSR